VIALDLSRLLSRAGCATPTGIDRVELAYARHLLGSRHTACFTARNAIGGIGLLPAAPAAQFVGALGGLWRDGATPREAHRVATLAQRLRRDAMFGGRALRHALRGARTTPVYLLVSHQNLDRPRPIAALKASTGVRFVCLIHDVIPLDFPQLTRPGQARRHHRRVAAVGALADSAIVNSAATSDALAAHIAPNAREIPIVVAPLGIDLAAQPTPDIDEPAYFVCIGTIEARKNHRLLLDVWQGLAAEHGHQTPRLKLIGQRGFSSERIAGRLASLHGLVTEHSDLSDTATAALLRGARALVFPSFAEGYGLPVAEALALGVPVLCSDLPALRETGGGVPEYLDPADGAAWRDAILAYADNSGRRSAQLGRLAGWEAPCWAGHFAIVHRLIAELR
jgi:glycosyltransferase involved in cell wall biosynthesis